MHTASVLGQQQHHQAPPMEHQSGQQQSYFTDKEINDLLQRALELEEYQLIMETPFGSGFVDSVWTARDSAEEPVVPSIEEQQRMAEEWNQEYDEHFPMYRGQDHAEPAADQHSASEDQPYQDPFQLETMLTDMSPTAAPASQHDTDDGFVQDNDLDFEGADIWLKAMQKAAAKNGHTYGEYVAEPPAPVGVPAGTLYAPAPTRPIRPQVHHSLEQQSIDPRYTLPPYLVDEMFEPEGDSPAAQHIEHAEGVRVTDFAYAPTSFNSNIAPVPADAGHSTDEKPSREPRRAPRHGQDVQANAPMIPCYDGTFAVATPIFGNDPASFENPFLETQPVPRRRYGYFDEMARWVQKDYHLAKPTYHGGRGAWRRLRNVETPTHADDLNEINRFGFVGGMDETIANGLRKQMQQNMAQPSPPFQKQGWGAADNFLNDAAPGVDIVARIPRLDIGAPLFPVESLHTYDEYVGYSGSKYFEPSLRGRIYAESTWQPTLAGPGPAQPSTFLIKPRKVSKRKLGDMQETVEEVPKSTEKRLKREQTLVIYKPYVGRSQKETAEDTQNAANNISRSPKKGLGNVQGLLIYKPYVGRSAPEQPPPEDLSEWVVVPNEPTPGYEFPIGDRQVRLGTRPQRHSQPVPSARPRPRRSWWQRIKDWWAVLD